MSGLINKVKDVLGHESKKHDSTTNSTPSSHAGPHSSDLMNMADPRVDSDRDDRGDPTSRVGGHATQDAFGITAGGGGLAGTTAYTGNTQSTNAGPHASNAANKLDPRVDSDQDNRAKPGSIIGGHKHGEAGGPFTGSNHGAAHSTAGPHDKDALNKLDPRVDSDKDGSMKIGGNAPNF